MFPYRRILFPVDFSAANEAIVPYVREMTERFQASLQLVRACAPEVFYAAEFGWQIAAASVNAEKLVEAESSRLEAFAKEHFSGLEPELLCKSGHATAVIERVVRSNGIDLIMIPTHGHSLFRRLLLGSISARLIHDLSCSVWTGCHIDPASAKSHIPYRRILCAVEPGMDNSHVVKAGERMAIAYSACLSLVSVLEWPAAEPGIDAARYWERMRSTAESDLTHYAQSLPIRVATQVASGPIPKTLRDAALQQPSDLMIIGRGESQSALSGLLSNLYAIVRESPCPVLSV